MAQLPPAPVGVDLSTAEQYTVPPPQPGGAGGGEWQVDTGYYWLIQSCTVETDGPALSPQPATPILQAADADGNQLIDAAGPGLLNTEDGEETARFQFSPDAGGGGPAWVGTVIGLPAVWLPPASTIGFALLDQNGAYHGVNVLASTLVVTRAHYTGTDSGSGADVPYDATPTLA